MAFLNCPRIKLRGLGPLPPVLMPFFSSVFSDVLTSGALLILESLSLPGLANSRDRK